MPEDTFEVYANGFTFLTDHDDRAFCKALFGIALYELTDDLYKHRGVVESREDAIAWLHGELSEYKIAKIYDNPGINPIPDERRSRNIAMFKEFFAQFVQTNAILNCNENFTKFGKI